MSDRLGPDGIDDSRQYVDSPSDSSNLDSSERSPLANLSQRRKVKRDAKVS